MVNDGHTYETAAVVARYPRVRLINQANARPVAARDRGAEEGSIIMFTDDDCVPTPNWLSAIFEPFKEPDVIGVKRVYPTYQTRVIARFVQVEYEDRYRLMAGLRSIDFIDTYSAGFGAR